MRMLENEGFVHDGYIDIFDGGPTMTVGTDDIATIRNARTAPVVAILPKVDGGSSIVARGRLATFRAAFGRVAERDAGIVLDEASAALLNIRVGDVVTHVPN